MHAWDELVMKDSCSLVLSIIADELCRHRIGCLCCIFKISCKRCTMLPWSRLCIIFTKCTTYTCKFDIWEAEPSLRQVGIYVLIGELSTVHSTYLLSHTPIITDTRWFWMNPKCREVYTSSLNVGNLKYFVKNSVPLTKWKYYPMF